MFPYIANTPQDEKDMLKAIGFNSIEDFFDDIPKELRLNRDLHLKPAMTEAEIKVHMEELGSKNRGKELVSFLGGGVYDRHIPSVINHVISRSEFYTAYTPYQPEISQGMLQAIFEYQTMITSLTGMDVSNASLYDGASAVAEAAFMAVDKTRNKEIIVPDNIHPNTLRVLKTYLRFKDLELVVVPTKEGTFSKAALEEKISKDTAGVLVQNPNFYGLVEDEIEEIVELTHKNKALLIMSVDPITLGVLKSPGDYGADIAVGDGQSLGNGLNFGGPYFGFMAATTKLIRKMPGRIVGQTKDKEGKRGFVLTLQTREQHIRREKATSNICTNQALNALAASVYMVALGKKGITEVATQSAQKAHYLYNQILEKTNFTPIYDKPFFMEFGITSDIPAKKVKEALLEEGILGGIELRICGEQFENGLLVAVTEKRTKKEMDQFVQVLEGLK